MPKAFEVAQQRRQENQLLNNMLMDSWSADLQSMLMMAQPIMQVQDQVRAQQEAAEEEERKRQEIARLQQMVVDEAGKDADRVVQLEKLRIDEMKARNTGANGARYGASPSMGRSGSLPLAGFRSVPMSEAPADAFGMVPTVLDSIFTPPERSAPRQRLKPEAIQGLQGGFGGMPMVTPDMLEDVPPPPALEPAPTPEPEQEVAPPDLPVEVPSLPPMDAPPPLRQPTAVPAPRVGGDMVPGGGVEDGAIRAGIAELPPVPGSDESDVPSLAELMRGLDPNSTPGQIREVASANLLEMIKGGNFGSANMGPFNVPDSPPVIPPVPASDPLRQLPSADVRRIVANGVTPEDSFGRSGDVTKDMLASAMTPGSGGAVMQMANGRNVVLDTGFNDRIGQYMGAATTEAERVAASMGINPRTGMMLKDNMGQLYEVPFSRNELSKKQLAELEAVGALAPTTAEGMAAQQVRSEAEGRRRSADNADKRLALDNRIADMEGRNSAVMQMLAAIGSTNEAERNQNMLTGEALKAQADMFEAEQRAKGRAAGVPKDVSPKEMLDLQQAADKVDIVEHGGLQMYAPLSATIMGLDEATRNKFVETAARPLDQAAYQAAYQGSNGTANIIGEFVLNRLVLDPTSYNELSNMVSDDTAMSSLDGRVRQILENWFARATDMKSSRETRRKEMMNAVLTGGSPVGGGPVDPTRN